MQRRFEYHRAGGADLEDDVLNVHGGLRPPRLIMKYDACATYVGRGLARHDGRRGTDGRLNPALRHRHVAFFHTNGGLEPPLFERVRMRASQINGCANCLDVHSKDARAAGETEQRLYSDAWSEAVSEKICARVQKQFDEKALADLTFAVVAINGWNRLAISSRSEVGTYRTGPRP